MIVSSPYAVIEPVAVMIELSAASIALAAVLRIVANVAFTDGAAKYNLRVLQGLILKS